MLGKSRWRSTTSGRGRSKALVTVAAASSRVRPPTATPPTVTLSAITASEVVVVVPGVVAVRTTPAETPPAAARPSTNNKARPARFTGASLAREDAGIVRDHAVYAELVERLHLIPRGERPGQHRRADRVTALDDRLAHDLPVEHRGRGLGSAHHPPDPPWQRRAQARERRPHERREQTPLSQAVAVLRIRQPEPETGLERMQRTQGRRPERADDGALDETAVAHGLHQGSLCPARLQVELNPARARGQEGEPFVERRELGRDLGVRMGEDERAVQLEHVDLDEVAAELHRECERRDRVLGCQCRRAAMADPEHAPVAPSEVDHVKRLRTTTARSSPSSPAKARQSATSASAISCAGRSRAASRAALSRFSPYSSPARRASGSPSV